MCSVPADLDPEDSSLRTRLAEARLEIAALKAELHLFQGRLAQAEAALAAVFPPSIPCPSYTLPPHSTARTIPGPFDHTPSSVDEACGSELDDRDTTPATPLSRRAAAR